MSNPDGTAEFRRYSGSLSDESESQLAVVGISPSLVSKDWHLKGLTYSTRLKLQSFTERPGSKLAIKHISDDSTYKLGLFPDPEGSVENIGSSPAIDVTNGDSGKEHVRVSASPTALLRMVEPIASTCRALELVGEEDEVGDDKILSIGMRSLFTLGLARAMFEKASNLHDDAEYVTRLMEINKVKPTLTEEVGPFLVDEVGLMLGGAVAIRFMQQEIIDEFKKNSSPGAKAELGQQLRFVFFALSMSRKTRGEHSLRRRVSYALEQAYTPEQMKEVVDLWFDNAPDPEPQGGPTLRVASL